MEIKSKKRQTFCVKGMYCESCDLLVQTRLSDVAGVSHVSADHRTQKVEIEVEEGVTLDQLQEKLDDVGYRILEEDRIDEVREPYWKRFTDAAILVMIFTMFFLLATEFNVIPSLDTTGTLSLTTIFLIGVLASVSTCMATTGALYLSTIARLQDMREPLLKRMGPSAGFMAGRIGTYTFMGFVNGVVGQVISEDLKMESTFNLVIGVLMVLVGLEMLKIFSFSSILPWKGGKTLLFRVERMLLRHPRRMSVLLGASTYWLPCGFTQSVQLYALSVADPVMSTLIMLVFVLGTTPSLIGIGFASGLLKTRFYGGFMKVIGVFVFMVGLGYSFNYLTLNNLNPFERVTKVLFAEEVSVEQQGFEIDAEGRQILRMSVSNGGYTPNRFTVKQGQPVKWIINGEEVFGCQGLLQVPKIGISRVLEQGENIVEFIPQEKGIIAFSCSAGSVGGSIEVM